MSTNSNSSSLSKMEKGLDHPDLPRPHKIGPRIIRKANEHYNKTKKNKIADPPVDSFKSRISRKTIDGVEFIKIKHWKEGDKTPLSTPSSTNTYGQFVDIERRKSSDSKGKGMKNKKTNKHKKINKHKKTNKHKSIKLRKRKRTNKK